MNSETIDLIHRELALAASVSWAHNEAHSGKRIVAIVALFSEGTGTQKPEIPEDDIGPLAL